MNKHLIFKHYSDIIDNLIDNSLYFDTFFLRPWSLDESIHGGEGVVPLNISLHAGATRCCIVDENYDWVVKFDVDFDNFGSACEREKCIYEAAKTRGLEDYFCEVEYIGTYERKINFYDINKIERFMDFYTYDENNFNKEFSETEEKFGPLRNYKISIPLYAYRYAEPYDCGPIDDYNMNIAQKFASPLRERNIAIATAFVREFGVQEYSAFSAFSMENNINDIHFANIGEVDGHFCLIDYAGYHNGEESSDTNWMKGEDDETNSIS